ncbi:MAG: MFS transporter [Kiloniellales bacterium]|nr:MFS transporter [Kiloniellales bacterium]
MTPVRLTTVFCLAQMASLTGMGAVPGLLPLFFDIWSLSSGEAGWLTGAYFIGYMTTVPLLTSITDRVDARWVFLAAALLTVLSLLGFSIFAVGFWTAAGFQVLSGIGLAGTYMPGLKALTDRLPEENASRAVGFYTAISATGSAFSLLMVGLLEARFGWQMAIAMLALGPALSFLLILLGVRPKRPELLERHGALLDFRPVFANRRAIAYIFAYGAHAWELFALRSWLVAFLVFSQGSQPSGTLGATWSATAIAAFLVVLGLPASVLGNELSGRRRRRWTVISIMGLSAAVAAIVGFSAELPFPLLVLMLVLYTCTVSGESASVTAGAVTNAFKGQRGATLAVHAFIGFAGASAGPVVFGWVLGWAGGPETSSAWGFAFVSAGLAALTGAVIVWRVGPRPSDEK